MEFCKSLMTSENALIVGSNLIIIGIIFFFTPKILKGHYEACDQTRQTLKQEALQLGQTDRYKRLTAEGKSISKIPTYSKAMIITGLAFIVTVMIIKALY
jgi:hypothetical protein